MRKTSYQDGWNRIDAGTDVEVQHGVPVRVSHKDSSTAGSESLLNDQKISDKVLELTGFRISVKNWINIAEHEQESAVCIDRDEFNEVLRRLALSSAAMFVDRFHRPIDQYAVDWDNSEFNYDFNHAAEHCCLPYDSLDKKDYFKNYVKAMHDESVRLINEGISPIVEAE